MGKRLPAIETVNDHLPPSRTQNVNGFSLRYLSVVEILTS